MKNRLLILVLLFVMSFQVLHAFVIEELDTHACEVSEYVLEFSQPVNFDDPTDICNIHSEFHLSFVIPENLQFIQVPKIQEQPYSHLISYDYDDTKTFLIPPKLS